MNDKLQNFDEVVLDFQKFLSNQGWPNEINWVPRGGIVFWNGMMFIRTKSKKKSKADARNAYATGVRNGLRQSIEGICCTSEATWAHVSSPFNQDTPERFPYRIFGSKMCVSGKPVEIIFVTNILYWLILNIIGEKWSMALDNRDD